MKTLQEQYNLLKEGKGNADVFLKSARRLFPEHVTNHATKEEATVFSASFDEMASRFASHGHGADLRACTDPFCMEAKSAILEAVSMIQQQQQGGQ